MLFSRTCKDLIPGFSRTQNPFFQDFPGHVHSQHGLLEITLLNK